jgi:hypothetical protein
MKGRLPSLCTFYKLMKSSSTTEELWAWWRNIWSNVLWKVLCYKSTVCSLHLIWASAVQLGFQFLSYGKVTSELCCYWLTKDLCCYWLSWEGYVLLLAPLRSSALQLAQLRWWCAASGSAETVMCCYWHSWKAMCCCWHCWNVLRCYWLSWKSYALLLAQLRRFCAAIGSAEKVMCCYWHSWKVLCCFWRSWKGYVLLLAQLEGSVLLLAQPRRFCAAIGSVEKALCCYWFRKKGSLLLVAYMRQVPLLLVRPWWWNPKVSRLSGFVKSAPLTANGF